MQINEVKSKPKLDELEVLIQLLVLSNPKVKKLSYKNLAELLTITFNVDVEETDINLLYEPTLQNEIVDSETYYANLLNYSPIIYNYEQ